MGLALSCVLAGFALCLHADNLLLGAYALEAAADLFTFLTCTHEEYTGR